VVAQGNGNAPSFLGRFERQARDRISCRCHVVSAMQG
jgi:hypothetical protein